MTIALWALGVLLVFAGFMWWNHRHAEVATKAEAPKVREGPDLTDVAGARRDANQRTKKRKPRRKGYAGHGRIPRTGGWF